MVSLVSTNMFDTTENNYWFSIGSETEFLSDTLDSYRILWISIGNGLNFYRNVMSRNTNKKYISIGEQHASIVLLISTAKLIKLFSIGIFSIGLHFYRNYSRDLGRFLPSTEVFFF